MLQIGASPDGFVMFWTLNRTDLAALRGEGKQICNYRDNRYFRSSVSFCVIVQRLFVRLQYIKSHYLHTFMLHAAYYTCISGAVDKLKRLCVSPL